MSVDKAVVESLSPLERAIVAIVYSIRSNRVGLQGSEVYRVLNTYLEAQGQKTVTASSFNEMLKRLNTAGIIRLKTNKRAINPLDYYWIYKKYPETILNVIFETDESLRSIQKFL